MVNVIGVVRGRKKETVNVNKSKVLKVLKSGKYGALNVQLNDEKLKELGCFRYLW